MTEDKYKQIIETAIKRGWKKKWKHLRIELVQNKENFIQFVGVDSDVMEECSWHDVNLEEIEELKELCRVLWKAPNKNPGTEIKWIRHFKNLVFLEDWSARRDYIIKNFK